MSRPDRPVKLSAAIEALIVTVVLLVLVVSHAPHGECRFTIAGTAGRTHYVCVREGVRRDRG